MSSARTIVIIATYNERENLPRLVEEVEAAAPHADLLVIDDNSPDGTGRWCDERSEVDPRLSCLHRPGKLGLGSAAYDGFRYAMANGYDSVLTLDADFSHPPERLPDLLALLDHVDVAVGSRYCDGGRIEGWPLSRKIASRLINAATRIAIRSPVSDSSGAFRGYRVDALRRIDLSSPIASGYAYLEEILWRLKRAGATFEEAPITFVDRQVGDSKITWKEAVAALSVLGRLGLREWTGFGRG